MTAPTPAVGATAGPSRRDRIRAGVEPLARGLARLGLSPNALTVIGFGIAALAAYTAAERWWLYTGVLVAFGALFDLFDGAVARATGRTTRFGAFLDSTLDRAGEAVVFVGLVAGLTGLPDVSDGARLGPLLAGAAMAAAFMVSYTRAKSESMGFTAGRGMAAVGLAPREVRVVILSVGLIVGGILSASSASYPAGMAPAQPLWWLVIVGALGLIAILATLTTIQRILHVHQQAKRQEQ
jgi:phosphatidylglycerophosphate synthase